MSAWIVYSKTGAEKCKVRSLEYNGEFLGACSVSANINSPYPIGFEIGDWLEYRGERFELNYDPSVIKESSANTYGEGFVYDNIVFNSLSDELTRCDFLDYVREDNGMHYSSLPTFSFYAETIEALAERIEVNLDRIYTGEKKWTVEVHSEHINTKNVNITISNQTCWDALGLVKTMFDANFIIRGRRIIIGTSGIAVGNLFSYGKGNGLYKIEKNAESGQKIITRLRAYGSTRNLPASYYRNLEGGNVPNNMAVRNLMLPSFPSTLDPYIDSKNIDKLDIREGTIFFDGSGDLEEIFPTLEGMTAESLKDAGIDVNATGELDVIVSAEKIEDDGIIPEEGQGGLKGSFTVELKDIGFDINDYLSTEAATLSMKDGMCGGRDFEITKCEKTSTGYRLTCNRHEDTSLGLAFPYNGYQIKSGDKFVLLNIEMPDVYVKAASQRLLVAASDYLSKNDYVRYSYTPTIDNIWVARQHEEAIANNLVSIHDTIKEGDFILFEDKDLEIQGNITIDSLTIKENADDNIIPEYELTLKNEKTVGTIEKIQNQVSSIINGGGGSSMNTDQVSSIVKAIGSTLFLSKKKDDRSTGTIASDKGFEVGKDQGIFKDDITSIVTAIVDKLKNVYHIESPDFQMGELGNGYVLKYEDGKSYFEVDEMLVRRIAYFIELIIKQLQYVGGEIALTPASMKCTRVEEYEEYYRCYFEKERDGQSIKQEFRAGDQARAQSFNIEEGVNENVSNQYYWRLVVRAESDENFIDLSKIDCDTGSLPPRVGDGIVQLGNRTDASRQNAIILSTIGDDAPSIKQYEGINSYSLEGKDVTVISPKGNKLKGDFLSKTGQDLVGRLDDLGASLDDVINQTDKVYTIWFYDYNPSSSNYPTNEWIDEAAKQEHVEDIFYNQEAGMAWRYQKVSEGVYAWVVITDHETIKALENAAKAQATADKKMQNFVTQPVPPYSVGDRWSNAIYGTQYDNDELVCINAKAQGESFSINDWQLVSSMSSADKKHFYSEFERTDTAIQSLVADGKTKDEAIAAANAAAKAASDAASAAAKTANTANETANTTASALTQTNKSISSIVVAFERNADGSLKLDANGSPRITSAAGSVITNEMAGIYATKTTVDGINGRLGTAESNISATSQSLTALSKKITFDSSGNITNINKSGLVAESNFASLFSTQVTSQGVAKTSQLTAYVAKTELGDLVSKIAISADQIDLTGKVTFNDFNQSLKNTVNGKVDTTTIISGGYIKTELLNVTEIHATSGSVAGFKISNNNLTNEGFSSDAAVIFKYNNNIAAIGSNVIPIESGANGAAYFQCHTEDSSRITKNYGMVVSAAGTGENVAIGIDGGCVEGFAMKNRIISGSGTVELSIVDYNVIVTSSSACVLVLPAMRLCDDGHVVRIKRLGSGGVTFKAKQCETFTSGTTGRNYPGIIYGSGKHVGSGNVAEEDKMSQYDSCEFVWVRDLRVTLGGITYNGAWIQYKMPKSW